MKWRIIFEQQQFEHLRGHLLRGRSADEEAAFLFAGVSRTPARTSLLVREIVPVPDQGMLAKGRGGITISPEFIAPLAKKCRESGLALIQTHSHPFSDFDVHFSGIDDAGESRLFPKILARAPHSLLAAIVFGQRNCRARIWDENVKSIDSEAEVVVVGDKLFCESQSSGVTSDKYTRQVSVIGPEAQRTLSDALIGIVGLGGTGSHVMQQLTYLGASRLRLIDPDVVEESNLSRLVGANDSTIGERKVSVLRAYAQSVNPQANITAIPGNIFDHTIASALKECDVIFGCTDNLLSRMVLTRVAAQYLIPLFDMGINVQCSEGEVQRIGGRVTVQRPGDPCLDCLGVLDSEQLATEVAESSGQVHRAYVNEREEFAPAVVSLNGIVASLAVTEFLRLISRSWPSDNPRVYRVYDGVKGIVRAVQMKSIKPCGVCTEVRAMGDLNELPVRLDR